MKKAIVFSLLLGLVGCTTSSIFQPLGNNIASPNGIVIDEASNRLYLINANSNVLYNWEEGSVQIYDITDPLNPVLLDTIPTESFSGDAVLDNTRKLLYTSNRFSPETNVTEDHLLSINIDETSVEFEAITSATTGKDPYGLYCCYPADRMWISNESNSLDYIDLATSTVGSVNLLQPLSNGSTLGQAETAYITVNNNQAFLPRLVGGLLVVNLDEVGDATKNPLDYFVDDLSMPGGIATDGTYLYVVDEENQDEYQPLLLIFDLSQLPPVTDSTTTQILHKNSTAGLLVGQVAVAKQPKTVFLSSQYAFVTSGNYDENGYVSVIDLASQTLIKSIAMGEEPFGMQIYAPGGVEKYLYVGDVIDNTLTIIDIPTLTIAGTYP